MRALGCGNLLFNWNIIYARCFNFVDSIDNKITVSVIYDLISQPDDLVLFLGYNRKILCVILIQALLLKSFHETLRKVICLDNFLIYFS